MTGNHCPRTHPIFVMMLNTMVANTPRKNIIEMTDPNVAPSPSPPGVLPPARAMPMSTAAPSSARPYFSSLSRGRMRLIICLILPVDICCFAPRPAYIATCKCHGMTSITSPSPSTGMYASGCSRSSCSSILSACSCRAKSDLLYSCAPDFYAEELSKA